jgi:NCS1 family nucleobase:cation symporter-1
MVASIVYWVCCRLSPIPATSDHWMEVGDEIRNISMACDDGCTSDFEAQNSNRKSAEGAEETARRQEVF